MWCKENEIKFELQQKDTLLNEICEYKRKKEIQLAYTDGWKDTAE
jgi:hypothetical protein